MPESIGKRFAQQDASLSKLLTRDSSDLNFSKGFSYKDTNLDNVHNSADEIMDINRTKLEGYIGESIPTKKMSDEEIDKFGEGLTPEQARWINNKLATDEYDTNTLVSYVNHWDEWANPYADGTGMYEKKNISTDNGESSNLSKGVKRGGGILGGGLAWELGFRGVEGVGKRMFNKATPFAKDDVPTIISNANAEPLMDKIDSEIARIGKDIETLKANGGSKEEITRLENAYNQLIKQKNSRSTEPKQTIRDFVREEGYAGSNMDMATDLDLDKDTLWITDIEEKMAMSDARFKKSDILRSLTREDFGVSEAAWEKEYKPIIDEYIEFYADKGDDTLLSLQEWKNEIGKTFDYNEMGEKISSTKNNIKSRVQDKIGDTIKGQLDKEYPGQGMSEKVTKYGKLKTAGEEFTKRGGKEVTKTASKSSKILAGKKWYKYLELNDGQKRTLGSRMERIGKLRPTKIWNYVKGNKKLMALIGLGNVVLKNPAAQAGLTALEVMGDVDMANDAGNFIDEYKKFAPIVQRIHARFADDDTRIGGEFSGMTEEEKEMKYPTEEVLKDLQWLSDNGYEDFLDTYRQYEMPDFLGGKTLKLADFDEIWDYVGGRLKNEDKEKDISQVENMKRKLNGNK